MPGPIRILSEFIIRHAVEVEGIFRKSGGVKKAEDLLANISGCYLKVRFRVLIITEKH